MPTLNVGLDLGLSSLSVCFLLEDGTEPIKRFTIPHTPDGFNDLFARILTVAEAKQITNLSVGMESTGVLHLHISEAVRDSQSLRRFSPMLYLMNAKLVAQFKKAFPEKSKDDDYDAYVVAERLRFGGITLRPLPPVDGRYEALRRLTRHRFQLMQQVVAEKNRFLELVFLKCSGMRQGKDAPDVFGVAVGDLLTEHYTIDEIGQMSIEQLTNYLREHSGNNFRDPEAVAKTIRNAANNSHHVRPELADQLTTVLSFTLDHIRFLEKQIKDADAIITKELKAIPNTQVLLSVPGLGPVFTAGILAEVQDVSRFASDAQLAKYAGIVWRHTQSGNFEAENTPLMRHGNMFLRYYLVQAANSLRVHNEEYAAYYQVKYREVHTHQHKRACVLTARKLVRLLHALLRRGQLYQPVSSWKEHLAENANPTPPGEIGRHAALRRKAKRAAAGRS